MSESMERVPTFALFIVRLDGWYQSRVWHAASTAARLMGIRLVAIVGSAFGDPQKRGGPSEIYDLARWGEIDGYLPLVGALANFEGVESVRRMLLRLPPRPTVCIGMDIPGLVSVVPDGGGIDLVVRHLAGSHGLRKIFYVGGNASNPDAIRRKSEFIKTMAEYGLDPEPGHMPDADFTPEPAYRLMAEAFDRHGVPQAVVCANDAMALGVARLCRERGLRIPQDILLTGYDNIEEAATQRPPLTTVDAATYQVAFRSMELLREIIQSRSEKSEVVRTNLIVRRSCGCRNSASSLNLPSLQVESSGVPDPIGIRELLCDPAKTGPFLQRLEIAFETADQAELDLWEERIFSASRPSVPEGCAEPFMEAHSVVSHARHGLDLNRRQALQFLLRDQYSAVQKFVADASREDLPRHIIDSFQAFEENHMRILLFKADCSPLDSASYGKVPFELEIDVASRETRTPHQNCLLPEGEAIAANWITLPLSLGREQFGAIQVRDWTSNELFLESLRDSLAMVLSLAHKSRGEREMRDELRRLSHRDELTGLLNRRGLLAQGESLVRSALRHRMKIGIVLCDLDGLKPINDTYGHADGDLAIRCLAKALEDGFRQSDILGRLGGDEFAVVTQISPDTSLDGAVQRMRDALARRSDELARPWTALTSAGWMVWDPGDGGTLESALSRADAQLYQDKRLRGGTRSTFIPRSSLGPESDLPT